MTTDISGGELCEATDLTELSEFFAEAWSEDPNAAREETIRWRYRHDNSDRAYRGTHLVWRDDGGDGGPNNRIVAHMGILPVRVAFDGNELDSAWLLDWLVLKTYRGTRVGTRLMREALARHQLSLAVGLTYDSEIIFRRAKWFDLGLLNGWGRVDDGGSFLRARYPIAGRIPGVAPMANLLFARRKMTLPRRPGWEVHIADLYPDDLSLLPSARSHASIPRDEKFLSARYGSPAWTTKHVTLRYEGRLRAWSAWSVKERADGLRIGMLLEHHAVVPAESEAVFRGGIGAMQEEKADLLFVNERGLPGDDLMKKHGFLPRAGLKMMGYWREGQNAAPEAIKNPERWIVRGGDSDMDR